MSDRAARQWLTVARREFLERVRTAWFVVVTLLGPIGMIAIVVVPVWLSYKSASDEVAIVVLDRTGRGLGDGIAGAVNSLDLNFRVESAPPETGEEALRERIRTEEIDGFLVLPEDLLEGGDAVYRGDNATNLSLQRGLSDLVNSAVRSVRAADAGLTAAQVAALLQRVDVETIHTTGTGKETSAVGSYFVGYAVMFILYMAILLYGVNVMRSVVQEKTSRVVELIVSATRPRSLMLGKILGVGGVGVFQLSIWAAFAIILVHFRGEILGLFGIGGGGFDVPPITAGDVFIAIAFFLLGFFFYASLFAAIGAMVNSDQEAQQAQTPVMLLLIIPAICVQLVANDPRGPVAEALTLIPFSSPILMPMRYLLGGAGPLDLALCVAILLASIAGAVWLAARIYRVGILMYGKRPSLRELARWVRH